MLAIDIVRKLGFGRNGRRWRGVCPGCGTPNGLSVRRRRDGSAILVCPSCPDKNLLAAAVSTALARDGEAASLFGQGASSRLDDDRVAREGFLPQAYPRRRWYLAILLNGRGLTPWEREFLTKIQLKGDLTESEHNVIAKIHRAVSGDAHLPTGTTPGVVDGVVGLIHKSRVRPDGRSESAEFTPAVKFTKEVRKLVFRELAGGSRRP